MKGEKKMREYLKGKLGDEAMGVLKGNLKVEDLFKMAKAMDYDGEMPDEDEEGDDVHIDVNVGGEEAEDAEDLEKGQRILDALADVLDEVRGEDDLFDTLHKSLRDSDPFAEARDEADGLRKSNAQAGALIKSLISGVDNAFKVNTAALEALGNRVDSHAELAVLSGEGFIQQRQALDDLRAEMAELRKSLGMPDPKGITATPAARFPGEGSAAPGAPEDLRKVHAEAMGALRKSIRAAKGGPAGTLGKLRSVSNQMSSLENFVQRHGDKAPALLKGFADGSLIKKITD